VKGTDYIEQAVDRLKKKYDFEFILIHKLSYQKARDIYSKADIIVDQLMLGAHGLFAVEGMALGKPVICYIREDLRKKYPADLPLISAHPDNIYQVLGKLLRDPKLRRRIGKKGRVYAEKYHDAEKISQELIDLYEDL